MSIKELSQLCNVHYNTMRKWLVKNKVKKASTDKNASFLITDDVIKKAKKHFLKDESVKQEECNNVKQDVKQSVTQDVTHLIKQLEEKDKQIENLHKLLENQQILTLKANEKIELLESRQPTEQQQKQQQEEQPQEHKSIFKRLFKK